MIGQAYALDGIQVSGLYDQLQAPSLSRRLSVIKGYSAFIWPDAVIPYEFDSSVVSVPLLSSIILDAIRRLQLQTPVRFVVRTTELDYLMFRRSDGMCNSFIGRVGGAQM